ncbi:10481_t:CDS:2 [Funneliformis mosseae]|uniref:10481_t:CDS:1 n=1 Tax=Funneliformis mosseae TaxID=27381 RepID=A0A9N9AJA6_FUNMO|nr:10481_t:CDS:2 [Funneliformis mosseae]
MNVYIPLYIGNDLESDGFTGQIRSKDGILFFDLGCPTDSDFECVCPEIKEF